MGVELNNIYWLQVANAQHRLLVIALMLIATLCFGFNFLHLSESQQLLIAIVSVGFTGLSHGAVDHLVDGAVLKPYLPLPLLVAAYLFLALLVVISWQYMPALSLMSFLALSAVHFGSDLDFSKSMSARTHWIMLLVRGSIPILIPCYAHQAEVGRYFSQLGCATSSREMLFVLASLAFVWFGLLLILVTETIIRKNSLISQGEFFETASLVLMCWFVPPLISFALYFCALHSFRQILRLASHFDPIDLKSGMKKFLVAAAPLTLASVAGSALFCLAQPARLNFSTIEIRALFVSLAALTLPHMMLGCAADMLRFRLQTEAAK